MRQLPESGYFWLALAAVVLTVGVGLAIGFWDWLHPEASTTVSNSETLRNVGLLVGGALAFVFAGWRAWLAEQEKATARRQAETALLQAKTAERQSTTALRSLINERYEQGSSKLASDDPAVRVDGIDMLERLAREHPSECHVQVIKRLSLFVRTSVGPHSLRQEIRAAMAAIGSRSDSDVVLESDESLELNLSGSNLQSVHLAHLNLSGANLMHANLSGAFLLNTDLSNASLQGANLKHAFLLNANFSGTQFSFGEGDSPAEGVTQAELNMAHAYKSNLPKLDGVLDALSRTPLDPPPTEPDWLEKMTKSVEVSKQ